MLTATRSMIGFTTRQQAAIEYIDEDADMPARPTDDDAEKQNMAAMTSVAK